MFHKKHIYFSLIFLLIISLILAGVIWHSQNQKLKIIFFNVGQGDAIMISQGQNQILIDGGPSGQKEMEKLGKYIPFWDRKIEIVIATHPDQDHIGGLIDVMKNYKIGKVIDNSAESDSQVYKNYLEIIENKNIERLKGKEGMNIKIKDANLEIIYPGLILDPPAGGPKDTNSDSIVAKLIYGQNSFLFTGDFPLEKESALLIDKFDLISKVLKVSHHGSKNATSQEFLSKVSPFDAIISVGKNNSYGHPAGELLERLRAKKINILRTDEKGDIEYICKNLFSCQMAN
ncbi:MAG: Beta-lactamase domain protein [Candidatus Moranbacteria bacterium GW2011_GWF2_36_839]|nr:MAG: Beta-lactamase domain protein [Candidatus Moranbacteria bacterium GW2011_GWF1_36_78]KKQ17324.1 MAG: Beta-lactamase domain protein [Candidatus Moranbacteria bacterium GW2011_GWF2_36_839]HAT73832.1 MBL fold metallo-hydrolase [Candidatus Moranbacteria bacterium]HBY11025.1 MBL fold metallo-hydrolase [Candidatus Moranbacteria bacterium]